MPLPDSWSGYLVNLRDPAWSWSRELAASAAVVLFGIMIYLIVSRLISRLRHSHLDPSLVATLRVVARWLFVILTAAGVMQVWGVLDQFWAAATALVTLVAIGFFAVWSVLSNVLCSIILLAARPFRIGDRVGLPPDEMEGVVEDVTLLHTVLRTADGGRLKVPNNLFFQRVLLIRPAGYVPPPPTAGAAADQPDAED